MQRTKLTRRLAIENLECRELLTADLSVVANTSRPVYAGAALTYFVTVSNLGSTAAANVSLTAPIPTGLTFISQDQTQGPAFTLAESSGSIHDTIASLPAGATARFEINMQVPSDTPNDARIVASANVSTTTTDSDPSNNHFQGAVKVHSIANVSVVSSGTQQAKAGNQINYTIVVGNNGPSDAQNVVLTDALPVGLTLVSQTQVSGTPFTLSSSGNTITDSAAAMKPGTFARFFVVAQINPGTTPGTVLTNTASATADNEANYDDNSSSVQTKVLANSGSGTTVSTVTPATQTAASSSSAQPAPAIAVISAGAQSLSAATARVRAPKPAAVDLAILSL